MKSVIQWVGGKGKLLEQIHARLPNNYKTYYEPFLGSGAVLLSLTPSHAVCGDMNENLVFLFNTIRANAAGFISELRKLRRKMIRHPDHETFYYQMRARFNEQKTPTVAKMAVFMYLNRNCFNALYRENKDGAFNVPYGKQYRPDFFDVEDILRVSEYLVKNKVRVDHQSYTETLKRVSKGDFVFLDPPYIKQSEGALTQYVKEGFSMDDQVRLAALCRELDKKGAYVMITNSDNRIVRKLYKGFNIKGHKTNMNLNRDAANRKKSYKEVIITNY